MKHVQQRFYNAKSVLLCLNLQAPGRKKAEKRQKKGRKKAEKYFSDTLVEDVKDLANPRQNKAVRISRDRQNTS